MENKNRKDQIEEVLENQNYILDAIKNLNERLVVIEENVDDDKLKYLKEIIESQSMIDEILVRNSDDVALMQKAKVKTDESLRELDSKIKVLDKELEMKYPQRETTNEDEPDIMENIVCRHHNGGFCKHRSWCRYKHPLKVCESFLKDGKCNDEKCSSRHPKICRYQMDGCSRGDSCAYLHKSYQEKEKSDEKDIEMVDANEYVRSDNRKEHIGKDLKCDNCQSDNAKSHCKKCNKFFCDKCELKVNNESILEFFISQKYENYTCSTVHLDKIADQILFDEFLLSLTENLL